MIWTIWATTKSYEGPSLTFPKLWLYLLILSPFIVLAKVSAWFQLTQGLGIAISIGKTLEACLLSILGRYIPGKVFFVLGRLQAYGLKGEALRLGSFGMIVEFIFETMAGGALLMLALTMGYFSGTSANYLWGLSGLVLSFGLFSPSILRKFSHLHPRLSVTLPSQGNLVNLILIPLFATLIHWAFYLCSLYLWMGDHLNLSPEFMLAVGAILSFASLLGTLSLITPGGIGVREGLATLGFTAIGLDWQQGLALAFAARCILWVSEIFCGGIWFFLSRPSTRVPKD
mgnify:CR=1 FL=1|jgi:glycosyltransferase 2 family protein